MDKETKYDVIVVGGGNAALCAAISAADEGARVVLLERAPQDERGGNSSYTEGLMRCVYDGSEDIFALSPDLSDEEKKSDFGAYTEDKFFDDMARTTQNRTDPDLCELLVRGSNQTMHWLKDKGIRWLPQFGRQSFKVDGKYTFWGGATLAAVGGGPGLVDGLYKAAEKAGVTVVYEAWTKSLIHSDDGVHGVVARVKGATCEFRADSVILACGGFEANAQWRARHLGPGWDLAKVRGSKYNTGHGLQMAIDIGAQPWGHWSGCHSVGWERYASDFGDPATADDYERDNYPFAIMVNADGKRFVDEGADIRNYTYAKYGRIILSQPMQFAWQIFDASATKYLRPEYRSKHVTKVIASSLDELVEKIEDVNKTELRKTILEFNAAVKRDVPFSPNVKDGRCTVGLELNKSNWAIPIENPPFEAYAVTCGITFTFGGVRITNDAQVVDTNHRPIPGLYAAGEMVGGLFYFNYPGATGLMSGAVFGRIAGKSAAATAKLAKAA